jgi:HAD superfamily hydrolase (TIGR01509 family)
VFDAIIFDFNGVLVDDEAVHLAAFRDVLAPLAISVSDDDYTNRYLGFDDAGAFEAILTDAGRPPTREEVGALIEKKRPFYMRRAEASLVVFEGAVDLLTRCAELGPIAIVSGALRDEIHFALGKMGVRDLVTLVVSAEDTKRGKPDPEGYNLAVLRLGEAEGRELRLCLAIEDSLAGIQAAKGAGLLCLAVAHSYPQGQLEEAGADHVARAVRDVDAALLTAVYQKARQERR